MENNLSYYKIFYIVAKNQNISKAAKELYISQPAISKAVTKLEQNLNTILFIRNSRGVKLTYEGNLLFEECKIAFTAISNGELQIRKATELNMGQLKLGVSTTLCKYILLPYLKRFMIKYPYIKIEIVCAGTFEIINMMEFGSIDIGLIAKPKQIKKMEYFKMGNIQDAFVVSPNYINRLQRENKIDSTQELWEKATLMVLNKENITRQHIDSYFNEKQLKYQNLLEVTSMDLLIEFSKIGIGIACVIIDFVKDELRNGDLIEVFDEFKIPSREIGFICNSESYKSKALNLFLDMMK
jgi:DNA-binding transcriptional LysR family regulator